MSKFVYCYDEVTGAYREKYLEEVRPEYNFPSMEKGPEFDHVKPPAVEEGQNYRWDGTKYIIEDEYPILRNATWIPGEPGQFFNGQGWQDGPVD